MSPRFTIAIRAMKSGADYAFPMLAEVDLSECRHKWQAFQLCLHIARISQAKADRSAFTSASMKMLDSWAIPVERETEQRLLQLRSYREALKHSAKWDRSRAKAK